MPENPIVLVVDDVPNVFQLIRAVLSDYEIDIRTAVDGRTGLKMAREMSPDLILLDLALPLVDGWTVLAELKSDEATRELPVVIVTAHGDSSAASRAREMGADGFISKPFRPAELRRVIDEHLGGPLSAAG